MLHWITQTVRTSKGWPQVLGEPAIAIASARATIPKINAKYQAMTIFSYIVIYLTLRAPPQTPFWFNPNPNPKPA